MQFVGWIAFVLAGLAMLLGAKALDDRDRRQLHEREARPRRDTTDPSRSSYPPAEAFGTERDSLEPGAPTSDEIPLDR